MPRTRRRNARNPCSRTPGESAALLRGAARRPGSSLEWLRGLSALEVELELTVDAAHHARVLVGIEPRIGEVGAEAAVRQAIFRARGVHDAVEQRVERDLSRDGVHARVLRVAGIV